MQTTFTCFTYSRLQHKLNNNINNFLSKFQLLTIYSAVSIILLLTVVGQLGGGSVLSLFIIPFIILALSNALGYYFWDIVKSAYKQIKEENENIHPAGNYTMNTYEKSAPAQYNHHV